MASPGAVALTVTGPGVVDEVSVTAAVPPEVFSEALESVPLVVANAICVPSGIPVVVAPAEFLVMSAVIAEVELPLAVMLAGTAPRLSTRYGS